MNSFHQHPSTSLTFFEALRQQLLSERRRVFSSWYAQQQWAIATATLPKSARRWRKAPDSVRTGALLARFRREKRIIATEQSPSIYVLQDPSLPTSEPTAHELLSAIHPDSILSYESAVRVHQLTLRFTNQIHCSWDASGTFQASNIAHDIALSPPRQRARALGGQPISWHKETPTRLAFSERLDVQGVWMLVATIERTLVDGLARPQWCGGPAEVFQAWKEAFDIISPEAVEAYTELIDNKVLYQRVGFVLETLGHHSPLLDQWAQTATPGGSAILVPSLPWMDRRNERWKLGLNFEHGLTT